MLRKTLSFVLVLVIVFAFLTACSSQNTNTQHSTSQPITTSQPVMKQNSKHPLTSTIEEIHVATSYADILNAFSKVFDYNDYKAYGYVEEDVEAPVKEASDSSYSETNIQVAGYDEADFVKTDGSFIYILGYSDLKIFRADAENSKLLSSVSIVTRSDDEDYFWEEPMGLFVFNNRVVIFLNEDSYDSEKMCYSNKCHILIYDVSDPASPKLTTDLAQDGSYQAARMTDGIVYLVTFDYCYDYDSSNELTYVPCTYQSGEYKLISSDRIYLCPNATSAFSIASSVDIAAGSRIDTLAFTDACSSVYMDESGLYLLRSFSSEAESEAYSEDQYSVCDYESRRLTEIKKVSVEGGKLSFDKSACVDGSLYGQYGFDVRNGTLRIATTSNCQSYRIFTDDKHGWSNYEWGEDYQGNNLFVLDESLQVIGSVENFAEEESIYAVRFMEDLAYVITYEQIDPLFVIDLSDPTKPAIADTLEISGVSYYLHMLEDGQLFGLGTNDDFDLNAVMFDVSNPQDISANYVLSLADYSYSEALYNPRAILIDKDKKLIAFPADESYVVLRYSDAELSIYGTAEIGYYSEYTRGVIINDYIYICDSACVSLIDLKDAAVITTFEFGVG